MTGWGLAWHLDVENGKLQKVSFNILVAEKESRRLMTRTLTDRYAVAKPKKKLELERYAKLIYATVTRTALEEDVIRDEYVFWEVPNE